MIPVTAPAQFRRLGWIVIIAAVFCIVSIITLTLLLPHESAGGFLPIPAAPVAR